MSRDPAWQASDAVIRRGYAEGTKSPVIAAELGAGWTAARVRTRAQRIGVAGPRRVAAQRAATKSLVSKPEPELPPAPKTSERHACKWPVSGTGIGIEFCGSPVRVRDDGRVLPYCPSHCERAYQR